jgi:FixJ family two-component response regulator
MVAVVEDDDDVRCALESLIRSSGFEVRAFGSAEAYLADPHRPQTDCLLTDLHLPALDGLGLHAALRALGFMCPVVVMTAFPTEALQARAMAEGVAAFLSKPVDPDVLLEVLVTLLGGPGR